METILIDQSNNHYQGSE